MDFVERFTGGSASQRFRVDALLKWTDLYVSTQGTFLQTILTSVYPMMLIIESC